MNSSGPPANSGGSNSAGSGSSGSGRPGGPNPNNNNKGMGGFKNRAGIGKKRGKDKMGIDYDVSDKVSDRLYFLKGRSYSLLKRLNDGNLDFVSYLEVQKRLINNEKIRSQFISTLHNDRLNQEFLYNSTNITQYIFNQIIDN